MCRIYQRLRESEKLMNILAFARRVLPFILRKAYVFFSRALFASCGKNVTYFANSSLSFENIILGDNVYIGPHAFFAATHSKIIIHDYVVFGPFVTIMGGDHNISEIGSHIFEVHKKNDFNDQDVIIEKGCWIGTRVTILKGVTVGEGSVIGAGSVVTKSVPPYTISAGNPAKVIRQRFKSEDLAKHKALLKCRQDDV